MIDVINRKLWSVEGTISWDMNEGGSLAKLQALSGSVHQSDWTFSHANFTIYSGKGKPVGDLAGNSGQATLGIKIQGGGNLSEIS